VHSHLVAAKSALNGQTTDDLDRLPSTSTGSNAECQAVKREAAPVHSTGWFL